MWQVRRPSYEALVPASGLMTEVGGVRVVEWECFRALRYLGSGEFATVHARPRARCTATLCPFL